VVYLQDDDLQRKWYCTKSMWPWIAVSSTKWVFIRSLYLMKTISDIILLAHK
jgi:hypothetical protein